MKDFNIKVFDKKEKQPFEKGFDVVLDKYGELHDKYDQLKETLLNVITSVEKERKLSGNGKQLPVIKEAYNLLKSLK